MISTDGLRVTQDPMELAYKVMLERVYALTGQPGDRVSAVRADVAFAVEKAVALSELTREEAERIAQYLERDVNDAAVFIANTGRELRQWWRFDVQQIEQRLMDMFTSVADKSSLQMLQMNAVLNEVAIYLADEVTGPGSLVCRNCEREYNFTQPSRIQPCTNCQGREFFRVF